MCSHSHCGDLSSGGPSTSPYNENHYFWVKVTVRRVAVEIKVVILSPGDEHKFDLRLDAKHDCVCMCVSEE